MQGYTHSVLPYIVPQALKLRSEFLQPGDGIDRTGAKGNQVGGQTIHPDAVPCIIFQQLLQRCQICTDNIAQPAFCRDFLYAGFKMKLRVKTYTGVTDFHIHNSFSLYLACA